jgi:tetratricopeptide (TPR) repeat protein
MVFALAPQVSAQAKRQSGARSRSESSQPASSANSAAKFDQLTKQAGQAREANRLEESVALYLQALRIKPKWKEGWWYVGAMLYERDQYPGARDAFLRFVAIDQQFGPALALLGLCEFQLRQYEPSLAHLRAGNLLGVGENKELRRVTHYHEAILHNRFEQYELAYDVMSRMADERWESPNMLLALGLSMLRMSYLPEDVPADKREMVFKTGRAASYLLLKRQNDAAREFKELAEAYPDAPGVHYAYGVYLLRDAPDAAIEQFRREIQISPNHVAARLQIAFEMIKEDRHAEALPFAEAAARLAPDLFAAHNALGRVLVETGDLDRGIKELELGAKLAPDSPEMHFALARAYIRAGRPKDAERARAEFTRLEKLRQAKTDGSGANGSPGAEPQEPARPKP